MYNDENLLDFMDRQWENVKNNRKTVQTKVLSYKAEKFK